MADTAGLAVRAEAPWLLAAAILLAGCDKAAPSRTAERESPRPAVSSSVRESPQPERPADVASSQPAAGTSGADESGNAASTPNGQPGTAATGGPTTPTEAPGTTTTGGGQDAAPHESPSASGPSSPATAATAVVTDRTELANADDLTEPAVRLSESLQRTCLLSVGDVAPNVEATDIQGQRRPLAECLGDRLTMLLFWDENSPLALEQFQRLPVDVLSMFASGDLTVVAVNVGGQPARVRQLTGDAADKIVSLVDADGTLFGRFASALPPRTYVLNSSGRILWFDTEYSLGMQRDLTNALHYFLLHDS